MLNICIRRSLIDNTCVYDDSKSQDVSWRNNSVLVRNLCITYQRSKLLFSHHYEKQCPIFTCNCTLLQHYFSIEWLRVRQSSILFLLKNETCIFSSPSWISFRECYKNKIKYRALNFLAIPLLSFVTSKKGKHIKKFYFSTNAEKGRIERIMLSAWSHIVVTMVYMIDLFCVRCYPIYICYHPWPLYQLTWSHLQLLTEEIKSNKVKGSVMFARYRLLNLGENSRLIIILFNH